MTSKRVHKYKVIIVEISIVNCNEVKVCHVGYFDSEEDLEKWARENKGELKRV